MRQVACFQPQGSTQREKQKLYSLLAATIIIIVLHPVSPGAQAKPSRLYPHSILPSIILKFKLGCCKYKSPELPFLKAHSLRI